MLRASLIILACALPISAAAETVLLMAEEDGCVWCAKWDSEISHIYPKTAEGRTAPLERYDLRGETPAYEFTRRVTFTPTFLLIDDGQEVGRIEGYPGEDFFWPLLNDLFARAGISLDQRG
ncbi:hypothetical protein GFB49_19775 [Epibacterium sp. SM1979]|uniref:Regulatory protein SoxS n=1 Tax=Tritonibacter litoralis TaxID=2662264 RepID=A0A843YQ33_9RHOB|nr:hypothetical protein [Tritonibacter litoralis]MQQ10697.1 hypothetical protein [Tritonibacter litoralis]